MRVNLSFMNRIIPSLIILAIDRRSFLNLFLKYEYI